MKTIPTLFIRDDRGRAIDEINPECQWVFDGEGIPTVKWDGSACLYRDHKWFRRHRIKEGAMVPDNWIHHSFDLTQKSGHGWLPISSANPADQFHIEAAANYVNHLVCGDTYELVGPKMQKNPYNLDRHEFWRHGWAMDDCVRTFIGFKNHLTSVNAEGIVFWHPDGRMAKIKRRDFGIPWPVKPPK